MADPLDTWINPTGGGNRNSMQYLLSSGLQTSFEFNFVGGYIDASHVHAYIYHSDSGVTTEISPVVLTGPNTIEVDPPVPAGDYLVVYRETPKSQPLVDFASGAVIDERSLDTIAQQAVFAAAEMVDRFSEIKSSSDDAIVRSFTAVTIANEAKSESAAANAASAAAVNTANSANATSAAAQSAASAAVTTANNAESVANGIDAKATQAMADGAAAVVTANAAEATANGIDAKANQALSESGTALTTANSTATYVSNTVAASAFPHVQVGTSTDNTKNVDLVPDGAGGLLLKRVSTGATILQVDATGNVLGKVPAFRAHLSTGRSNGLIIFDAVEYDTAGWYNPATGRYTPQIAGVYLFTARAGFSAPLGTNNYVSIHKNGSVMNYGEQGNLVSSGVCTAIQLNGSSDYVQIDGQNASGGINGYDSAPYTYFAGHLVTLT